MRVSVTYGNSIDNATVAIGTLAIRLEKIDSNGWVLLKDAQMDGIPGLQPRHWIPRERVIHVTEIPEEE